MEWHDIEVDGRHTVKFTDLPYVPLTSPPQSPDTGEFLIGKKFGGMLRHGEWAWLAKNSTLQVVSLRNGQTISSYEFCESRGYEKCCIKCVEEVYPKGPEVMLLAIVLESYRGSSGGCSYVAIYSVELSRILKCIELSLHLTCARFMDASACRRTLLQNFDGCLAVGSEEGAIVLFDLNIRNLMLIHNELQEDNFATCHIADYGLSLTEIHRNFRQCQKDGIHFGLQMEVIESPCPIQCIQPIDLIIGMAIGLEDGRLALYDLTELQIFYVVLPTSEVTMSALVKMDFLEPPDDPRPCLYIWTLHENGENLHAVLHSLMYEKRLMEADDSTYFESFKTGSVRLQLPLEATKSVALSCQAISTLSHHGEDDSNSLCAISWLSVLEGKNKLLIFDLNQWYKEEMPFVLEYGKQPNYLAGYVLDGGCTGLHTLLNPKTIAHFNSMQRFEEHFYPNSLSYESLLLHSEGCRRYNWEGAQNRVINLLRSSNAAIFLEPNLYFNEIIRTRLIPQFTELNVKATFSRNAKYEILLSVALEHNCVSLLRDCAKSWIDGSFMGNFAASTGLSLSTVIDWIWKRATCIKSRCNDLCKCLFEFGGYPLDNREQKELGFITRQLKLLSDLLKEILAYAKKQIPERVWHDLENKYNSLYMASNYQDILLWLLNIGLLPEGFSYNDQLNKSNDLIPYPHKELKEFYTNKRLFFSKINETFVSKKSGSCKLLFIDSFIDHVCKGNILQEYWLENNGDGLYPPNSLEAMLRVMLVPELDYENKCAILLYFFLDLNMAIDEDAYKGVVGNFIKFPSVFKLSAPLIKTVQAFWNLDHDHYKSAIDEFISPFNKNQCYPQWQVELLLEVLLNQKASNLALRVLESQPSMISPLLKLNTLLANELISEAFHFVRSKNDETLLETFFNRCLRNCQFGVIRDLALSEREGLILQNILKKSKAPGAESLHFVYLLQKSKYIEAVSYMDELSNKVAKSMKSSLHQSAQMETPNLVLSAFNTTMTPVTQGLTDVYFRIKNKIKKKECDNKSPLPLSCQLIKQNANNLLGGIYHSSALSAHFATYYWGEMGEQTKQGNNLLNSSNAPFLRRPQMDTNCFDYLEKNNISYPRAYKVTEKRTLIESEVLDNEFNDFERKKIADHKLNPNKKRRLIGQEIVDNLSHFMQKNKTSNTLNIGGEFTFGPEQISSGEPIEQKSNDSLDLLTKPVQRPAKEFEVDVAASTTEIHSILKTYTPEPGQQQRGPLVEEEKSLRFRLPSEDVSPTHVHHHREARQKEISFEYAEISQEEKSVEKEVTRKATSLADTPKISSRHNTKAILEGSNKSCDDASSNASEENFYSPLSSHNNSKLNCSNLSGSSYMSGPQPRKPLARLSVERSEKSHTPEPKSQPKTKTTESAIANQSTPLESVLQTKISSRSTLEGSVTNATAFSTADIDSKRDSKTAYVTAVDTLSKPLTFVSYEAKEEVMSQTTSNFGNTFLGSKISEFLPKNSSSEVGATLPTDATEPFGKQPLLGSVKLSECSTVLGALTTFDSNNIFAMRSKMPLEKGKCTEGQKLQMLETTLGMTTYDFSIMDSTSGQQTKSSLMVTANDFTYTSEVTKIETKKIEKEKISSEKQLEQKMAEKSEQKTSELTEKETNYDCIILSSSSSASSSSSSAQLEPEDDDYTNDYDDENDYDLDDGDNMEDDVNFELEDNNNNSEISYENIADYDYDEDDYNNEHRLIDETDTDTSRNTEEIEDIIQIIEDSSPEITQQKKQQPAVAYCDVKVIEKQNATDENKKLKILVQEDVKKEGTATEIGTEEKAKGSAAKLVGENEVEEIIPSDKFDQEVSKSAETSKYFVSSPQIDIRISEDITVSPTEVVAENKPEDSKQDDIMEASAGSDEQEKKIQENLMNVEHKEMKIDSKDVISDETEVKWSNATENIKSIEVAEAIEEEKVEEVGKKEKEEEKEAQKEEKVKEEEEEKEEKELMSLQMQDSMDDTKVKTKKQLAMKFAILNKAAVNVDENTEVVVDEKTKSSEIKAQTFPKPPADLELKSTFEEKAEDEQNETTAEKEQKEKVKDQQEQKAKVEKEEEEVKKKNEEVKEQNAEEKEQKIEDYRETVSAPRQQRTLRGSSVPPAEEQKTEEKEQKIEDYRETVSASHQQRTLRGSSVPPNKLKSNAEDSKHSNEEQVAEKFKEKSKELPIKPEKDENEQDILKPKETEDGGSASVSTPRKQRTLRASSVTPLDIEVNSAGAVSTPRRNKRGTSVPPQTIIEAEEYSHLTPRTRRSIRASSLQPKYKMEDNKTVTPRKGSQNQTQEPESTETRITRSSSLPPSSALDSKITTRRCSVLLDAINEDHVIQDSPSARTRLRSHLNSIDSELDSPIVGVTTTDHLVATKRSRKVSITNNPNEQPLTPKRTRRNSNTSQIEVTAAVGTPHSLRSHSVQTVQEEDAESIPASPTLTTKRRTGMKRKKSTSNEELTAEDQEHIEHISPKSDQSGLSEALYSSSRRLTRTQLAVMKKSAALAQESPNTPTTSKRPTKTRSTRSSNVNADSDDAESVSSKLSTTSSVTGTKRRVTRSSLKDKDDDNDEIVSVASSFASENHHQRQRHRSKDKSSPNTTLTTIPEDAPVESKKRGRPLKH